MEELTIDNTPVTNEKDQEAVIEAVLFTMGSAVDSGDFLCIKGGADNAVSAGIDNGSGTAGLPSDRIKKQQKQRWNG